MIRKSVPFGSELNLPFPLITYINYPPIHAGFTTCHPTHHLPHSRRLRTTLLHLLQSPEQVIPSILRALATKTLGDFTQFAKQNSKEMTADVLASVSRHISQLINSRERMVFEEARDLLKIIEGVDVSSLSLRSTPLTIQTSITSYPFCVPSNPAVTTPAHSIVLRPYYAHESSHW